MNQPPLYVSIPFALFLISATLLFAVFIYDFLKDRGNRK